MRTRGRHLTRLGMFALLCALLPHLAPEGHGPSEHSGGAGRDSGAVSYSAHPETERGLHIEKVAGVGAARCQGCLLPKKQASDRGAAAANAPTVVPGAVPAGPLGPRAAGLQHSPASPRAPPVL